jgi:hypothetical protein
MLKLSCGRFFFYVYLFLLLCLFLMVGFTTKENSIQSMNLLFIIFNFFGYGGLYSIINTKIKVKTNTTEFN